MCCISRSAPTSWSMRSAGIPHLKRPAPKPDSSISEGARMGLLAEVLLLAAAWFGHAFLLTVCLNWWYAQPLSRKLLKWLRLLIAILVFAFPFVLGWAFFGRFREIALSFGDAFTWPVATYLWLCWLKALAYVPVISVVRAIRRDPRQVVHREGRVVDVAARLGEKPIGDGKNWKLAKLPWNDIFRVEFG